MNNQSPGYDDIIKRLSYEDSTDNTDKDNSESNAYKTLVSYVTSLPPKQFILLSSLIGILLIDNIDTEDQFILGKFINNVGQTILTAAAQEQINIKKDK